MKYIDDLNLQGKRLFFRGDLNVPLENGQVADDYRIRATLPSIEYALKKGARVIIASHLGRPDGKRDMKYSLGPVAKRLGELLHMTVPLAPDCVGPEVKVAVDALKPGQVLLLENVRFHAEEEANDEAFAKQLAELCDAYVNDAFATAHRKHASTAGICKFVAEKAGGFTMKDELTYFAKAWQNPAKPLVAIFGGAKVSTKMAAIKNVASKADAVIIGGAMANTFFVARGMNVGKSLFEPEQVEAAKATEAFLKEKGCKLLLPTDVVVAAELKGGIPTKIVPVNAIGTDDRALDVGPKSVEEFAKAIQQAKTVIWNGPMGAFETEEFASGTYRMIDALVSSSAFTVVGGGDTDLALHRRGAFEKMGYVSTAGGAFLKLLEGATLGAVKALES